MTNRYLEYLRDNPKGYWFRRKLFGWGWTPARWQGWLTTAAFAGFLIWTGIGMAAIPQPSDSQLAAFFVKIGIAVALILVICWKTGEPPRWQWGVPEKPIDTEKENH